MELFNQYLEFSNEIGDKFKWTPQKVYVEIVQTYDIKKLRSNGTDYFVIDIQKLKKLLHHKYKWTFDEKQTMIDDDSEDVIIKYHEDDDIQYQGLKIMMNDFKRMYEKAETENENLREQLKICNPSNPRCLMKAKVKNIFEKPIEKKSFKKSSSDVDDDDRDDIMNSLKD